MIRLEEEELAKFSLTEGYIAVPFELYAPADGGEMRITVYPGLDVLAQEFLQQFSSDPFSAEAITWLKFRLAHYVEQYDLSPSRDADVHYQDYLLRERGELRMEVILPKTELVDGHTDMTKWCNATTHALEMDPMDKEDACAIHRVGSVIAAYAALNDFPEEEDVREIHVECAPKYRKMGYATSCAARLSKFLLERGYRVRYVCRHTNLASARVAEKAGFALAGRKYSFVCYRNDG